MFYAKKYHGRADEIINSLVRLFAFYRFTRHGILTHNPCDPSRSVDPFDPWPTTHWPIVRSEFSLTNEQTQPKTILILRKKKIWLKSRQSESAETYVIKLSSPSDGRMKKKTEAVEMVGGLWTPRETAWRPSKAFHLMKTTNMGVICSGKWRSIDAISATWLSRGAHSYEGVAFETTHRPTL